MAKRQLQLKSSRGVKKAPAEGDTALQLQTVYTAVNKLPPDQQQLVEQMLTDGATFEDVVEAIDELGAGSITLGAVERHFQSRLDLQQARIRQLVKTAQELKNALTDPQSAQAQLAEAVLLTGLMGLSRRHAASRAQHAIRIQDRQDNLRLKERTFRLKAKKFDLDQRILNARLRAEDAKLELLSGKIMQLKQAVERGGQDRILGPEIVKQIREIYGLVSTTAPDMESQTTTDA